MNRRRLKKLRNTLRDLRPCTLPGEKNDRGAVTDEATLCANAANLPAIDTVDIGTFHTTANGGPDSGATGCIAGIAIGLFPEAAAEG